MDWIDSSTDFSHPTSDLNTQVMAYVHQCVQNFGRRVIRNVSTQLRVLDAEGILFPVSINSTNNAINSYVVSPHTAYARYAQFELAQLNRPLLTFPLACLVQGLGWYLHHARVDDTVVLNNFLVSTNLYPPQWSAENLAQIRDFVLSQYPQHAFMLRSLNEIQHGHMIDVAMSLGFIAVPSRQIYMLDTSNDEVVRMVRKKRDFQNDKRCLNQQAYVLRSADRFSDEDFQRCEQLYNMLYLGKYSQLNPQYTAQFLQCGWRDGWLDLQALCDPQGTIVGVLGTLDNAQTLTNPILGYDTTRPISDGLYRVLTYVAIEQAIAQCRSLNMSAGAPQFKRNRGAVACMEYSLVDVRHLPQRQQRAWRLLSQILQRIAVPILQRWQL